jgi:hypothetical protein
MARRYRPHEASVAQPSAFKTKPPLDWVGRGLALVLQRSRVLIINILPSGTLRITSDRRHGNTSSTNAAPKETTLRVDPR